MIVPTIFILGVIIPALAAPTVDPAVLRALKSQEKVNVIVSFDAKPVSQIRDQVSARAITDRTARLSALYSALKGHADITQAKVLNSLESLKKFKDIQVRQLWISNKLAVIGADDEVIGQLMKFEEVSKIVPEKSFESPKPLPTIAHHSNPSILQDEQWNIAKLGAPEVWSRGIRGNGSVVAIIGTGVRSTHVALKNNYRAEYGWYDPYEHTGVSTDSIGYSTQTAGLITGTLNGIGVAPDAKWVACRGCALISCSESALLECGQWVLCPTDPDGNNPDCSKAPQVVSADFGGGSGQTFYDDVLLAWGAAGTVGIFSVGNSGPACSSVSSPGDSSYAIGVGAVSQDDRVLDSSSSGPSVSNSIKPNFVAPSGTILTVSFESDTALSTVSGSGLAQPHVAGVSALMYSASPNLTFLDSLTALATGAQPTVPTGSTCGGISDDIYPNNRAGAGRVYAPTTIDALSK